MNLRNGLLSVMVAWLFISYGCSGGFKNAEGGLKYKFHVKNTDSLKVNMYDIVTVYMNYRTPDSILFEGKKNKIPFQIAPKFKGDLMDGILLMHKGDSATFILSPVVFYTKMMGYPEVPEEFRDIEELLFDIKVVDIQPENESQKTMRLERENRMKNEQSEIDNYLAAHNITVKPTASGLYYIPVTEGTGDKPEKGNRVKVHYNGWFFSGDTLDSSYARGEPLEFVIGANQVIPGWDEGVGMMQAGGKATLIIPSKLGYGDQDRGPIQAYTPLVFDVELVEVTK